jgi:hypothetical protein
MTIWLPVSVINLLEGTRTVDDLGAAGAGPTLLVEHGAESGADQEIVVAVSDGAVIGWGLPDAPSAALVGAGEDLVLAVPDLVPELGGVGLAIA